MTLSGARELTLEAYQAGAAARRAVASPKTQLTGRRQMAAITPAGCAR